MANLSRTLSLGSSVGAVALALLGNAAMAQTAADTPQVAEDQTPPTDAGAEEGDDQTIVVTGTNISGVKAVGSEAFVLKREDILASGKTSVSEVLRTLPQVQNAVGTFSASSSGQSGNATAGSNATRGNATNFRGIGQGATLTLVDGHRITPSGSASAFTEANQVPISALERIEVIADGASAIYGSDAIAGVINYVLRKDFNGFEVGGRYMVGDYNQREWALNGTAGTHWDFGTGEGSILATFEHDRRDPYLRGLNPRLREDQRPYGGADKRVVANAATVPINGNIVVPTTNGLTNPNFPQGGAYTYYTLPLNPTGRTLTLADLLEVRQNCAAATCATYPNVIDRSDYEDYLGKQTRDQAAVFFNQKLGAVEIYDEFFWTKTKQVTRTFYSQNGNGNVTVNVNPASPFYIHGLPGTLTPPFPGAPFLVEQPEVVQINLLARVDPNGPRFVNDNPDESFNNTFGVRAKLFGDWRGDVYYTFGQNKTCGVCYLGNFISADTGATNAFGQPIAGLQNALQNGVDNGTINPFSTAPFTEAQLNALLGTNYQYSQNWSHDVVGKVDGSLFELPGGMVRAAFGGEYYHGLQKLQNGANRPPDPGPVITPDANARTTRTQYAGFAELYVPVVGEDMDIPLVESFIVDAAIRYDHYSDFGKTTNPKISATWKVSSDLSLRGSWGTSFRAPGLPELNAGVFSVGVGFAVFPLDPAITDIPTPGPGANPNILYYFGNNPNLRAEEGKNWQLGADFTPSFIPGLRLTGTYYNISYRNKSVGSPAGVTTLTTLAQRQQNAAYIVPIHNPAGCNPNDPSTFDPLLVQYANFLYSASVGFNPRNYCAVNVVIDGRQISAAATYQQGIDANLSYFTQTGIGLFNFNVGFAKILKNSQVTLTGTPAIDNLDTSGNPISMRGRGSITWVNGPVSASLFGNYVGGYRNTVPIQIAGVTQPVSDVPSWTTFDLSVAFNFPRDVEKWKFMRGVRFGVTVTNLFQNLPPIVNTGISGSSSIDLVAHNANGRTMQFQITKAF